MAILGRSTVDQLLILTVDTDPTVSGIPANIGSIALLDNGVLGAMWVKSAAGDTGWTPIPRLPTGTTSLQNNTLVYTDSNGFVKTDTTKFTWDQTNGRLGIGLAAPAVPQSTIHIDRGTGVGGHIRFTTGATTGQTSGDGFEIGSDNAGNAELIQYENAHINFLTNNIRTMRLNSGGELIIGTNAVTTDITGLSTFPQLQIIGSNIGDVQMAAIKYGADTLPPVFNLLKSRGVAQSQGLLSADDELGRLQFRGSDGVNFQAGASIRAAVDGTAAAGSMPGRLIFMTTPSGSTGPVERMRISQNGDVRVVDLLRRRRTVMDFDTFASANTTTTLTTASASIQIVTGSTAGQIIRMPDATTLTVGAEYEIRNSASVTLAIQDNAGNSIDTTPAGTGISLLILTANGTAAGTWYARTRFEPYYNEVSATAGMSIASTTDVLITGMTITPPAGTYRVHFDAAVSATTNNSTLGFAVYAGGTINTDSNKSFQFSPANAIQYIGTTGTVTVDGTQAIEIRGRRSAGTTTVRVRTMHILRVG